MFAANATTWNGTTTAVTTVALDDDAYMDEAADEIPLIVDLTTKAFFVYLGLLVVFGIIGNVFSIRLLLRNKATRHHSATQYLVGLAIGDIWMLTAIGAETLYGVSKISLNGIWGYCQWQMYTTYVCSFFSSWLIVAFSAERALVVRNPFLARRLTKRHARQVLAVIATVSFVVNVWAPLMIQRFYRVEQMPLPAASLDADYGEYAGSYGFTSTRQSAVPRGAYVCLATATAHDDDIFIPITVADLVLACLIPMFVLLVLNAFISVSLTNAAKRRNTMRSSKRRVPTQNPASTSLYHLNDMPATAAVGGGGSNNRSTIELRSLHSPPDAASDSTLVDNGSVQAFASSEPASHTETACLYGTHGNVKSAATGSARDLEDTGITRLLLTISFAYVLLNLPSYTIRALGVLTLLPGTANATMIVLERLCYMLFYTQFAVNFLLYSIRLRKTGGGSVKQTTKATKATLDHHGYASLAAREPRGRQQRQAPGQIGSD